MSPDGLVLRDIHLPVAPPWWPPAPGWWLVFAAIALTIVIVPWWLARRRRHRRAIVALFDRGIATAQTPAAQVAVMSELLRRAARRRGPHADTLQGDAGLRFLDGDAVDDDAVDGDAVDGDAVDGDAVDGDAASARFSQGAGRLLLEGGFQREVESVQVAALAPLARARYLELMGAKP